MSGPPDAIEFDVSPGVVLRGDRWAGRGWEQHPDVVMLHGGGQTRHSWKQAGEELAARGFRVTSIDSRGHGDSDWAPDGDYRLTTMANDARSVIAALGRPTVIVGASMGGLTGLLTARDAGPGNVPALVLVDVVPRVEKAGSSRIQRFMLGGADGFASLEDAADAIAAYLPHRPRPRSPEGLRRNLRQRADGRWYWHWDPAFMHGPAREPADPTTEPAADPTGRLSLLEDAARGLSIPTLLLRGRMSDVVSAQGVAEFRALVPQVQVVELTGAAHTAAGDDNEAFAGAVIDFVSRIG